MRPIYIDINPADESATALSAGTAGATWVLTANSAGDNLAHKVTVTSAGDESATVATITGTDADGNAQTENLVLGNATLVTSLKYFLTVDTITSVPGAGVVTVGIADEFTTKTYPMDQYREVAPSIGLDFTGVMSLDVQGSGRDLAQVGAFRNLCNVPEALKMDDQEDMAWLDDATVAAQTADSCLNLGTWPVRNIRFVANSYTSGAEVQASVVQSY